MTQQEIIELARRAGVEDSNEYDHLVCTEIELVAFAKLVAEKAFKDGYAIGEARGFKEGVKLERKARGEA